MAQNRSTAVMARRVEPPDSLDYFPTPPWATRALCVHLARVWPLHLQHVWEPACGEGHMARPLSEYFDQVRATDVHDYRATYPDQAAVADFLLPWEGGADKSPDWIITNPPFRLASDFVKTALERARVGVAVLVRTAFLEGGARYSDLFAPFPPAAVLQFVERVPIGKGRLDPKGSTATSYCWILWNVADPPTFPALAWLPPCRAELERAGDYPAPDPAPPGGMFDGAAP